MDTILITRESTVVYVSDYTSQTTLQRDFGTELKARIAETELSIYLDMSPMMLGIRLQQLGFLQ